MPKRTSAKPLAERRAAGYGGQSIFLPADQDQHGPWSAPGGDGGWPEVAGARMSAGPIACQPFQRPFHGRLFDVRHDHEPRLKVRHKPHFRRSLEWDLPTVGDLRSPVFGHLQCLRPCKRVVLSLAWGRFDLLCVCCPGWRRRWGFASLKSPHLQLHCEANSHPMYCRRFRCEGSLRSCCVFCR